MLKKILSSMMAGAMILALAVPAFAAESFANPWGAAEGDRATDPETSKIELTSTLSTPTLRVAVGNGTGIVFNPAQMKVTPSLTAGAETVNTATQDQVISNETTIKNLSNVPVKMYVQAQATEGADNLEFTNDAINDDETEKRVHLFLEVIRGGSEQPLLTGEDDTNEYTSYYSTQSEDEDLQKKQGWDDRKNQIAVTKDDGEDWQNDDNYVMIFAANDITKTATQVEGFGATTTLTTAEAGGKMKFFGSMTKNPTTPWSSEDQLKITISMKFAIMENEIPET